MTPAATPLAIWAALGTVYVVWGSTYLAIAYTIDTLPSLLSAAARFLAAAVVLTAVVVATRGRAALRATPAQRATAAVVGVLLLVGGNGLVVVAEEKVASGLAALLVAMTPVWIVILRALARDRPTAGTVGGVVLGFVGVAVLLLPGGDGDTDVAHALLVVLAALLWACGSYLGIRRSMPPDPFAATAYEMAAGGLALLVLGSVRGEWRGFDPAEVSRGSWLGLAYLVVFGSLVAFTAFVWLLAHAPVSTVATYAYVNPVVAVALGALLRDEPVTPTVLLGGLVIVAAVAVIVSEDGRRQRRARRAAALPVEEPAPG